MYRGRAHTPPGPARNFEHHGEGATVHAVAGALAYWARLASCGRREGVASPGRAGPGGRAGGRARVWARRGTSGGAAAAAKH